MNFRKTKAWTHIDAIEILLLIHSHNLTFLHCITLPKKVTKQKILSIQEFELLLQKHKDTNFLELVNSNIRVSWA